MQLAASGCTFEPTIMFEFWLKDTIREFWFTYGYPAPTRFLRERYKADRKLGLVWRQEILRLKKRSGDNFRGKYRLFLGFD